MNQDINFDFNPDGGSIMSLEDILSSEDLKETNTDTLEEVPLNLSTAQEEETLEDLLTAEPEAEEKPKEEEDKLPLEEETPKETIDKKEESKDSEEVKEEEPESASEVDDLVSDNSLNYKEVLNKLISNGVIAEFDGFETQDGEVTLEEADIDEEMFFNVVKQSINLEKKEASKDKISTKGLSKLAQNLIEIDKNGGDVRQVLESYQKYKNPVEQYNLESVTDQRAAIALKYQAKGLEDGEILNLLEVFETKGVLQDEAEKAVGEIESAFEKQMEAVNQKAIEDANKKKESLKKYRGELSESLKTFDLSDSYKKKLVDTATKDLGENSFKLDQIYSEVRNNPQKAAELVLFLTDKKEYIKQVTEQMNKEKDLGMMRKLRLIPKTKSNVTINEKKVEKDSKRFLDISDLT